MKNQILLIVLMLAGASCQQSLEENLIKDDTYCLNEFMKKNANIVTVKKQPVIEKIHLTGNIESNPDQVVHFMSLVHGVISQTFFSLGDQVNKGQVLAEVKSTELSALQASLQRLRAEIEVAKITLKSKEQLFKDGIASEREIVEAKKNLHVLETEKAQIQSNLQLFSAHPTKNVFQIRAPFSGIITAKNITSGTVITANNEVLFSISDLSSVWAMANVYVKDIAHIHSGMEVEIQTLSYSDEIFYGKIEAVSQVLDPEAKVAKARIVLDNKDAKLKPGMLADISVIKTTESEKIALPTNTLIFFNNKNYVLVYSNDCMIETREIKLLNENNGTSYVVDGLEENEKIITQNHLLIFEELTTMSDNTKLIAY